MENVFEIDKNFNFSQIVLDNPSPLAGGSYFTKVLVSNGSKSMYLQLPKVFSKQGIIKGKEKTYCDLMFNSSNKDLIYWFEQFEKKCQDIIFEKRELWFHNNITREDIEEMMNPIIRPYKSGKYFLIRVYLKNRKCTAFDEDKKITDIEKLTQEDEIIPVINFDGIKFSLKSIQLEIILTQYMQLIPRKEFEKQCLIKLDKPNKNIEKNLEDLVEDNKLIDNNEEIIENTIQNDDNTENNINNLSQEKEDILEIDNSLNLEKNHDDDENLKDISLELVPSIETEESISLKDPLEVYKEIYKVAKRKAFDLRQNALEAYLEAQNIKNKYSLEGMDDSEDETEFIELFKNNL